MPAAKKTAATKAAQVRTVSEDTPATGGVSSELEQTRDDQRKAEVESGLKDANGALLVDTEPEIGIDPALVEAREKELKAEKNRRTY